ncbi:glucosaminidase domain-containing protein [Flavobacterium ginsengiterrae]|uniref:Mannosyl-glycoprotein endo-beta-N-acetylglucosaminidase n=1 Tax=Flavobacterium ginsengiterrae TaxID=871695 RepID=A0ABP7GSE3_9FLAO
MKKKVIHNFDIVIKNDIKKSSEEYKRIFIKELAKVSKEMNLQKDIVQLWQEQQNYVDILNTNNNAFKEIETISNSDKIENVMLRDDITHINLEPNYSSISSLSQSDFFTSSHSIIDSSASIIGNSSTVEKKNNIFIADSTITSQVYTGISAQENIVIPQDLKIVDSEIYLEVTKTEIQKKFRNILDSNKTSLPNYNTTSADNVEEQEHYISQINFEPQNGNLETNNEISINNINWEKLSELMIFKLSELLQEEKNIYLKEYYDKLVNKISSVNVNIQELFSEHNELFLLLKSIFPALPEKISIQTKTIIYPDLGAQKMYPVIGVDNLYFKASGKLLNKTDNPFTKVNEDYSLMMDLIEKDATDPLHHQFLITTALKIYDAAKYKGATGKGALLIMAQASIESGYGKDAMRRGDYNLFGTSTTGNDYKVKNGQIKIKDYSNVGGYDASIKDYFDKKLKRWTGIANLIKNENFISDDIDKAFYTGIYIEDEETRNKTGHGAYNFDNVKTSKPNGKGTVISNNNKYGEDLVKQMTDFKKRLIDSIDYQIKKNRKQITEIKKNKESNHNNLNILIFIEPIKDFTDITIEILENENKRLIEIEKDIKN